MKKSPDGGEKSPELIQMIRFSLPFIVTGFLNQIVWRHSEVLFLGKWTGMEAVGYFGLAYDIPQMALEFVPLTIWPIVMAGTSEMFSKDAGRLPEAVDLYFRLLFILIIPVAAMGFAFSRAMVPVLFGAAMPPAALLTQPFFVVFSYSFLYTPLSMAIYIMGKSWINMLIFLLLAVLNVGLDLALIPRWGIWGAMVPVPIVLTSAVVLFRSVMRRERPDVRIPSRFIARCSLAGLPACAGMQGSDLAEDLVRGRPIGRPSESRAMALARSKRNPSTCISRTQYSRASMMKRDTTG